MIMRLHIQACQLSRIELKRLQLDHPGSRPSSPDPLLRMAVSAVIPVAWPTCAQLSAVPAGLQGLPLRTKDYCESCLVHKCVQVVPKLNS